MAKIITMKIGPNSVRMEFTTDGIQAFRAIDDEQEKEAHLTTARDARIIGYDKMGEVLKKLETPGAC